MRHLDLQPGDVGLSRGRGFVAWAIRWAEAHRYGSHSREARWNHAFLVVSESGDLIEVQGRGVERATLAHEYAQGDYIILRPLYPPDGARRAVKAMEGILGEHYGYLEILCEGLAFLFQTRLRFGFLGQHICSGAVSHAVTIGGMNMGVDEEWNSPADIMHVARAQDWQHVGGHALVAGAP